MDSNLLPTGRNHTALIGAVGSMAALLVAGCGGPPAPGSAGAADGWGTARSHFGSALQGQPGNDAGAGGASSPRYELVLLNDRAVHQDLDQLDPSMGKGYQPLRAFIYVKGRPRSKSPVNSVKPVCATPTECEYLPPRQAGVAERYTISIDDGSLAQLSADKDVVVISSRELQVAQPTTVSVTLAIPGQPTVTKRIVYGAPPG